MNAVIKFRPWRGENPPHKILVMRFQALGDTVITLPYLQSLRQQYPNTTIHFLTRREVCQIPESILLFDKVIVIGGGRNAKLQFILILFKLPWLLLQRYDAVLDLQNHRISKIVRKFLGAAGWAQFDRSSPISAGERTRLTIEALMPCRITVATDFTFKAAHNVDELLLSHGWQKGCDLVVLNPGGFSPSRSWPLNNYVEFARLWLNVSPSTQFVLLLLPSMMLKAKVIQAGLGDACINLTGKANQVEAFAILQKCKLMLSEDSGLMHMAWVQGISTLALFSSSRKDWSAPQGDWSACLDSSDMECGPCLLETCKFNDNRCLTRYTPTVVFETAKAIVAKKYSSANV